MGALVFLLAAQASLIATISVIGGAMVEVIAGINFVLYGKTTTQLANFHERLDRTQRFLLANSICESLNGEIKEKARAALVHTIATTAIPPTAEEGYSQQGRQ
jgi:O-acetylhomoserine/O-acetylserine sulfhydrylase-like pyridoxal-dependent enzyme